jgi:hypothetical protein
MATATAAWPPAEEVLAAAAPVLRGGWMMGASTIFLSCKGASAAACDTIPD